MLPGLRFIVGAALGSLVLILTIFGLAATVRITQQAKVGPIEPSTTLAYADPTEWNPFYDGDGTQRIEGATSKAARRQAAPRREAAPRPASQAPARQAAVEQRDEHTGSIPAGKPATVVVPPVVPTPSSAVEPASAVAEPVPTPARRVASLPSPAESAAAGVDTASRQAVAPSADADKGAPKAKRAAKARKKAARRRARARTAQPNANPGFSQTAPNPSANGSWPFPN